MKSVLSNLFALLLISLISPMVGSSSTSAASSAQTSANSGQPSKGAAIPHVPRVELPPSAVRYYQSVWGIEIIGVKAVESGSMLRFSYKVLDADKARALNDKRSTPYLYDLNTHARLEVPSMEKVGQLRQTTPSQGGQTYWMVFANQQRLVKPGSRVDIVIGSFRADGLLVE